MSKKEEEELKAAKKKKVAKKKSTKKKVSKKKVSKKKTTKKKTVKKKVIVASTATEGSAKPIPEAKPEPPAIQISDKERYEMIQTRAYFLAEARGFEPGHEIEDWLEAERFIDEMLKKQ